MAKYDPLYDVLAAIHPSSREIEFRFNQVDQILGDPLPSSAREHRAWWANPSNPHDHPYAQSWLRTGWKVDHVDFIREIVRFRRAR